MQILHEAGFVQMWKGFKENRPQTLVQLTELGRRRFDDYITVLESVVTDALEAAKPATQPKAKPDWSPA